MTEAIFLILGLVLFLAFDLMVIATRFSFLQTNLARLLSLRVNMEGKVDQTINLLPSLTRLRASLSLALVLARFIMAGALVYLVYLSVTANLLLYSIVLVVTAAVVLFWLEWAVERVVSRNPEAWALRLTILARFLISLSTVFLVSLVISHEVQNVPEVPSLVTEDELKTMVDAGQEEGILEQGERRMIYSVFELGDTLAREIMVPRIDMLALDVNTPLPDAVDALLQSGFSRAPVYEETVDKTLGLLYAKDLLRVWREGGQLDSLRNLLRPAYFVPEAKEVDDLLAEMQNQRIHMAIVVDEYGGVAGLVTLEDIVEEILGEIQDEYDQGEESAYQELKDGGYLFLGRIDLDDINEIMGSNLPTDEADTLGGFIYSRLGRVPTVGEKVQAGDLLLTVEQVSARRIHKVRAFRVPAGPQNEEELERVDR